MGKRDLKTDLEIVQRAKKFEQVTGWGSEEFVRLAPYFSNFHENGIALAEHAIERATKAENLVSQAESILTNLFKWGSNPTFDAEYVFGWNDALDEALTQFIKAKEVLGE